MVRIWARVTFVIQRVWQYFYDRVHHAFYFVWARSGTMTSFRLAKADVTWCSTTPVRCNSCSSSKYPQRLSRNTCVSIESWKPCTEVLLACGQALDLTTNRLSSIDDRILALTGLRSLCFRQNLLPDASTVTELQSKGVMEDLELRDNQIKQIPDLTGFEVLRRFEISYNQIRSMAGLTTLGSNSHLQELYVASNKITKIEGLESFVHIKILELGSNRISKVEGLNQLMSLEQLWMGRNRVEKIENIGHLTRLRQLSLQSNRLECMAGLEQCLSLEEVYLSHNGITRMEGLETLTHLKVLDVSSNRLTKIENLDTLTELEDLWLNDNSIDSWQGIFEALQGPRLSLTTLYLENNAVARDTMYRRKCMEILPNLTQLDANYITRR